MKLCKSILSIFICLFCIFSLAACGNVSNLNTAETNAFEATDSVDNVEVIEPTTNTEDSIENVETTTESTYLDNVPELEYKMVGLHKEVDGDYTCLWAVVEMETLGWAVSGNEFTIINNKTGEEADSVTVYPGNVCANEHRSDYYGGTDGQINDYKQYTLEIYIEDSSIDFGDLNIVADISWVSPDYQETEEESHQFEFNGTVDDLTTVQTYIHGFTLFEIDGLYYIYDSQSGGFDDTNTACYRDFDIIPINSTVENLLESFTNKIKLVYSTYHYKDMYLQEIVLPEHCEVNVTLSWDESPYGYDDRLYFGVKTTSENTLGDEVKTLMEGSTLKYIFDDGSCMYFICAYD